jgi:hypothetical protein
MDDNKTLLKALPTVTPKPGYNGSKTILYLLLLRFSILALLGSGIASIVLASNRKVFSLCMIIEIIKCFTVKLTRYYCKGKK